MMIKSNEDYDNDEDEIIAVYSNALLMRCWHKFFDFLDSTSDDFEDANCRGQCGLKQFANGH